MTTDAFNELAGLDGLRLHDVGETHATRLQARCHARLQAQEAATGAAGEITLWRKAGPAVAGAWCAIYVFETLRRAVIFYWS